MTCARWLISPALIFGRWTDRLLRGGLLSASRPHQSAAALWPPSILPKRRALHGGEGGIRTSQAQQHDSLVERVFVLLRVS